MADIQLSLLVSFNNKDGLRQDINHQFTFDTSIVDEKINLISQNIEDDNGDYFLMFGDKIEAIGSITQLISEYRFTGGFIFPSVRDNITYHLHISMEGNILKTKKMIAMLEIFKQYAKVLTHLGFQSVIDDAISFDAWEAQDKQLESMGIPT